MRNIIYKSLVLVFLILILFISYLKQPSAEIKQIAPKKIKESGEDAFEKKAFEEIKAKLGNNNNIKNKPPKDIIEFVSQGERLDFQCENNPENIDRKPVYGFEYSLIDSSKGIYDIKDDSKYGNNEIVKYCRSSRNNELESEGVILSGLIRKGEKKEQEFDIWNPDGYDVHIIPRIRIDSVFASYLENREYPVCQITITNEYGDTLEWMNLLVRNFCGNYQINYDGEYREEYNFYAGEDTLYIFSDSIKSLNKARNNKNIKGKYFNIQIYYYGYCDMWIDYVRVENEAAHQLLTKRDACIIDKLKQVMRNEIN